MFASPAPMYLYGSPAPTPYQSPASYLRRRPVLPRSQRPSTSPAQIPYSSYGTPTIAYPAQSIPPRSQRPATTGTPSAPQTPASQSMYGTSSVYPSVPQQTTILSASQTPGSQSMYGTSPAYGGSAPQPSSARPQFYGDPITACSPPLSYSNVPPDIPDRARTYIPDRPRTYIPDRPRTYIPDRPRMQGRRRTDTFVANDPFRPHPRSRHDRPSDDLTFDDIPVPGSTAISLPWFKYDSSLTEIPTSQYPDAYNRPPSRFYTPPASYPPIGSGQQNQGQPPSSVWWGPYQSSPHPGSSHYRPQSQPIYNPPSSATTLPMPYDVSSQYRPHPQRPLGQQVPYPYGGASGRTSSPGPTSQPPTQLPSAVETTTPYPTGPPPAPPRRDDNERPQTPVSQPPTAGNLPPDVYSPWSANPTHRPVHEPSDPSTFPPPPIYPFNHYYSPNLPYLFFPYPSSEESKSGYSLVFEFIVKSIPREVYYYFLLRLPSLYLSRVGRIFEEADLSLPRLKEMALATTSRGKNAQFDIQVFESNNVPPEYERLKTTWEAFIDSVMREWKTFNIISALLLPCVLLLLTLLSADLKLAS